MLTFRHHRNAETNIVHFSCRKEDTSSPFFIIEQLCQNAKRDSRNICLKAQVSKKHNLHNTPQTSFLISLTLQVVTQMTSFNLKWIPRCETGESVVVLTNHLGASRFFDGIKYFSFNNRRDSFWKITWKKFLTQSYSGEPFGCGVHAAVGGSCSKVGSECTSIARIANSSTNGRPATSWVRPT